MNQGCAGKQKFESPENATTALSHAAGRGKNMNVYRCEHCGGFHIGSQVGKASPKTGGSVKKNAKASAVHFFRK